jgi:hypothetical protein
VKPVLAQLKFSTDDCMQFIFVGHQSKPDEFRLVPRASLGSRGTNAVFNIDEQKHMNGMRVRLTWTFSACGRCAPLFVTVCGLSESELPGDDDLLVVKMPGLCIGGGGVGGSKEIGYIAFSRRTQGCEQKRFEYYQKHVLMPWIDELRKECGYDAESGLAVPDELTAVSWKDGDISQINAIAKDHQIYTDNKVIANKQNAARTGVEQPADLCKVFKEVKRLASVTTVAGIDPEIHFMKRMVLQAFRSEALKRLNLKPKKEASLVDFISVLPEIATKAATRNNIVHGFIACGLIDKDEMKFPVLDKILGTCRTSIPKEHYDRLIANFGLLYNTMLEHGRIDDELYYELGFPKDLDANGKEVIRDAGITQEWLQRSKWLNHHHQIGQRKQRIETIVNEQRRRANLAKEKAERQVAVVRGIRDKLSNILFHNNCYDVEDLSCITLEELDKHLNKDELGEFILAHDPNVKKKADMPKNKGSLNEAKEALENDTPLNEVNNRILWAFNCRDKPNKLDLMTTNSEENNIVESATPTTSGIAEITLQNEDASEVRPSELLGCSEWLNTVCELFSIDLTVPDAIANITEEDKETC